MAIYTWKCPACSREETTVQSIKSYCERPNKPICRSNSDHNRAVEMERRLTAPMVTFDTAPWASYVSPIDGSVITSRRERNEHMAKHGVVMYDEIKPDIERNAQLRRQAAFADIKEDLIAATNRVESGYKPVVPSEAEIIPTT
jgi:hypothetical protein